MCNSVNQGAYRYNDTKEESGLILLQKLCHLYFVYKHQGQQSPQNATEWKSLFCIFIWNAVSL